MARDPKHTGNASSAKPKKNSAGLLAFKAAGFTIDAASSVVSSIFKILGSLMLILLIAGGAMLVGFIFFVLWKRKKDNG